MVFDDAVMNDRDSSVHGDMGVGVGIAGFAVSGPTGMTDSCMPPKWGLL